MSRKEVSVTFRTGPQPGVLSSARSLAAGSGIPLWDRGVCRNTLSLCLLDSSRVETYTSENNELWKKVETLETANR